MSEHRDSRRLTAACLLAPALLACAATSRDSGAPITLPDIDISGSPSGIVELPRNVPESIRKHFVKYTKVVAPNGKPIHFLIQDGFTDDQVKHARNVLEFHLTDFPGSVYGSDKRVIADAMGDNKATMPLFNTREDAERVFDDWDETGVDLDLGFQDILMSYECTAVGSRDYMGHVTRDATYEEVGHLVYWLGIRSTPTLQAMVAEIQSCSDAAAERSWDGWPESMPENHPAEYLGVIVDNYYDLWAVTPELYEGEPMGEMPAGTSHFGAYFANSRATLIERDPAALALLEEFFPPHLTYTPELPDDFTGVFSLTLDEAEPYTHKSQHLVSAKLTGSNDADIRGNAYDNTLIGNAGANKLRGGAGDDRLDGGAGDDTAVFAGPLRDYEISTSPDAVTVTDKQPGRDGTDTLERIEFAQFLDQRTSIVQN